MAEAAGAVMNHLGENILYISVMNNLSIDCDCVSNPAPPELDDIGILGSLDPVAPPWTRRVWICYDMQQKY
jgi:uncharacterized Fe-S center protein